MNSNSLRVDHFINQTTSALDRLRQVFLRNTLKYSFLNSVFRHYVKRTTYGISFWTVFIFPLAIVRPDFLLLFGPLVFGYPHIIASYRFLYSRDLVTLKNKNHLFTLFFAMTALTIFIYAYRMSFEAIPFGLWQQALAIVALAAAYFIGIFKSRVVLALGSLIAAASAWFAWHEPLLYVGAVLILHNWAAYIHWIFTCKTKKHRNIAIISTIIFAILHAVVLSGIIDFLLPYTRLQEWNIQGTAWTVASWSENPLIWYRWLVLYTFGLSMHYFIWLRAIPETTSDSEVPLCFRATVEATRKDLGNRLTQLAFMISFLGILIWLINYPMGHVIYFQIALLHASLEAVFLPTKFKRAR